MDLLESAGFSRSNPYYVVQQGKVCSCKRKYSWVILVLLRTLEKIQCGLNKCMFVDSLVDNDERFRTARSAKRDWWYPCL